MYDAHEIIGINKNNNFDRVISVHQSTSSNCGLYVFINSLLITYIALHAPNRIDILRNQEVYQYLEKELTALYYDYYHSRQSQSAKDEFAIYFADSNGNIPNFTCPRSEFVANLREMYAVPILDNYNQKINIKFAGIVLDLAELAQHIILVENSFSKDCLCNNIFINCNNIVKMREFYSKSHTLISFIIGSAGHWKLYTINKIGKNTYQTIYLDSMGGAANSSFIQGINTRLLQFSNFDDFFAGVLECIDIESDININATDNLDFFITYNEKKLPPLPHKYLSGIFRKWIKFDGSKSSDISYLQSYRRMITRMRDNLNCQLIGRILSELPEWKFALHKLAELERSVKSGGTRRIQIEVHKPQMRHSKWVKFILS